MCLESRKKLAPYVTRLEDFESFQLKNICTTNLEVQLFYIEKSS